MFWYGGVFAFYLIVSLGILRPTYLYQYKANRVPRNGKQMGVTEAKADAMKGAAGLSFSWPLLLCAGAIIMPLFVVFDLVPKAARAVGRGVVTGASTTLPVVGAPVLNWVSAPVEREVAREEQLAISARADAGVPSEVVVPDSVALWSPPKSYGEIAFELAREWDR